MDRSPGEEVYRNRKGGALWSIACYLAGVTLRDGLAAAREYADANKLPWPPPLTQKTPGEFLGTHELRAIIKRAFLPRGVTVVLTPEQEIEGYRLRMQNLSWVRVGKRINCRYPEVVRDGVNEYAKRRGLPDPPTTVVHEAQRRRHKVRRGAPRLAYQLRLTKGLSWAEIASQVRYKEYRFGQYARVAARRFAEEEGLPWPVPSPDDPSSEHDGGRAYFYRGTGLSWEAVAILTGYRSVKGVTRAAQRHAEKCDLPWPIVVAPS